MLITSTMTNIGKKIGKSEKKQLRRLMAEKELNNRKILKEGLYPGTAPVKTKEELDLIAKKGETNTRRQTIAKIKDENKYAQELGLENRRQLEEIFKNQPNLKNLDKDELKSYITDRKNEFQKPNNTKRQGQDKESSRKTKSVSNNSYNRYSLGKIEDLKDVSKGKAQQIERLTKEQIGHLNASSNPLARAASAKQLGIEGGADMTEDMFKSRVHSYYQNQAKKDPTTMDHIWGHKVPQHATGGLVAAGVIDALVSSKGSQSNAQLYGQAPAPGM